MKKSFLGNESHSERLNRTLADFTVQRRQSDDIFSFCSDLYESIEYKKAYGHHQYGRVIHSRNSDISVVEDTVTEDQKEMIMMGSNSYLGLHIHPRVISAAKNALDRYGAGAGSPPHFSGTYNIHRELEKNLALLKGTEDAMVFPSGYSTNVGILSAFLNSNDTLIIDKFAHASIIDGGILSRARIASFRHNDMESLEKALIRTKNSAGDRLVAAEGVYSVDGDIAPLNEIYSLVKKHGAKLMVDDAHGTGVLGKTGRGSAEHFDLEGKIDIVMGTFSKALGGIGGFVCAKKEIIRYLRFYSRSYFFAASVSPVQAAALNEAVLVLTEEPEWLLKLNDNIHFFHFELRKRGFNLENCQTAITPVIIGDSFKAEQVTNFLHDRGVFVNCVPYPASPRKKERIRMSLSALHRKEDLKKVIQFLEEAREIFQF